MPTVTVLMPVHNGERHLRPAVESVLSQTWKDFELLVMDDGSTDASREIVRSFGDPRIRLVANERNLGLARTLNRALHEAAGGLIARQDADDVSNSVRLERQVRYLEENPAVALLGTAAVVIDQDDRPNGRIATYAEPVAIRWIHMFRNAFVHTSVMFRRNVVRDELGGYDESCRYDPRSSPRSCEDFDLWGRVMARHPVANLRELLVSYRVDRSRVVPQDPGTVSVDIRRVIASGLRATLGVHGISEEMLSLHFPFGAGLTPGTAAPFVDHFRRLVQRYLEVFPEAGTRREWRHAVRLQYATL